MLLPLISLISLGILSAIIYAASGRRLRNQPPRTVLHKRLEKIYDKLYSAEIMPEEKASIRAQGSDPLYGEIVYDSMHDLISGMDVQPEDVFYDLGSGLGKFVAYVHMATQAQKSVGIELSITRHQRAEAALKKMKDNGFVDEARQIAFVCSDMTEADISDATIIYMCSTCFSAEQLQKLVDKFVTLQPGLRIITLKELPEHPQIKFIQKELFPTSWWADGIPFFFYTLTSTTTE